MAQERGGKYTLNPGICSSPVLCGDTMIVLCDQGGGNGWLEAVDKNTGEVKWRQKRDKFIYNNTTPLVVRVNGKDQLIVAGGNYGPAWLEGLNPASGEPIWRCSANAFGASPVFAAGLVLSEAPKETMLAVAAGGEGDVTKTLVKWQSGEDQVTLLVRRGVRQLCLPRSRPGHRAVLGFHNGQGSVHRTAGEPLAPGQSDCHGGRADLLRQHGKELCAGAGPQAGGYRRRELGRRRQRLFAGSVQRPNLRTGLRFPLLPGQYASPSGKRRVTELLRSRARCGAGKDWELRITQSDWSPGNLTF